MINYNFWQEQKDNIVEAFVSTNLKPKEKEKE